jgi:hypothetical protein
VRSRNEANFFTVPLRILWHKFLRVNLAYLCLPKSDFWTIPRGRVAFVARAPIYGCYDTFVGHGIVGGSMVTFEEIGRKAAQLGIRILAGEDPQAAARSEKVTPSKSISTIATRRLSYAYRKRGG